MKGKKSSYLVPGAILVSGALIGFSVLFSGGTSSGATHASSDNSFGNNLSAAAANIRPVTAEDHIRGNQNAPVAIVEFSDFECPFCNRLHPTLGRIVEDFPEDVQWVYRHFPLTSIHSRALLASVASECAAELGGNDAFWAFSDAAFANQSRLGNDLYQEIAGQLGIDGEEFTTCLSSQRHTARVQDDFSDARNSGGGGTPYVVVINADGDTFPFSGALQYEQVRAIVQQAIES